MGGRVECSRNVTPSMNNPLHRPVRFKALGLALLLASLPGLATAADSSKSAEQERPDKTGDARRRLATAQEILTATQTLERLEAQQPPAGDAELTAAKKTLREALERLSSDATVRATAEEEITRLETVAREVERRRALREQAVAEFPPRPAAGSDKASQSNPLDETGTAARAKAPSRLEGERAAVRALVDALYLQRELQARTPAASDTELKAAKDTVSRAEELQPKSRPYNSLLASAEEGTHRRTTVDTLQARRVLSDLQYRRPAAPETELSAARTALARAEAVQAIAEEILQKAEDRLLQSRPDDSSLQAEEKGWWEAAGKAIAANRRMRTFQAKGSTVATNDFKAAAEEYRRAHDELLQRDRELWKARLAGTTEPGSLPTTTPRRSPADEKKRLDAIATEVAYRREIREAGAKLLSTKAATSPAEINEADKAPGKSILRMPNADLQTVAAACEVYLGGPVKVADRAGNRTISLLIVAETPAALGAKLREELGKHGLILTEGPEGKVLDLAPEK
jgi:hypothetical protein